MNTSTQENRGQGKTARSNKLIERGEKTRRHILGLSVDQASAEGLEGLTIGRLSKEIGMSKSGLFAHFGSKEDLQLATIKRAGEIFAEEIVYPVAGVEGGLRKLVAMLEHWVSYVERSVFRGGCFFFAASAEMDDRPGKVRDFVAELTGVWVDALEAEAGEAVRLGQLEKTCDVELLVFQLHGFVQEANWFFRLHKKERAFDLARRAIRERLSDNATKRGIEILSEEK